MPCLLVPARLPSPHIQVLFYNAVPAFLLDLFSKLSICVYSLLSPPAHNTLSCWKSGVTASAFVTYLFFSSPTEPHFLHAIEYGNYVYFFFSEIAVEYTTLGKVRGSFQTRCSPGLWFVASMLQFLSEMKSITSHANNAPTRFFLILPSV